MKHEVHELPVGETHLAHEAMRALRAAYEVEHEFVEYVDGVLRPMGYRLVAAFTPGGEPAAAVAGFRSGDSLAWGHYLYVDDLSTHPTLGVTVSPERSLIGWWTRDEGSDARNCIWTPARAPSALTRTAFTTTTAWRSTHTTSPAGCSPLTA